MTKLPLTLITAAALLALAAPTTAAPADLVTVSLVVAHEPTGSDLWTTTCDVAVPAGANGGDVLDQAVADGCLLEWSGEDYGWGRFVTSIDYVTPSCHAFVAACGYWGMSLDGAPTPYGIDLYEAANGDTLGFTHTVWTPVASFPQ